MALALVVNQGRLWQARAELENATDAAALAGAGALAGDALLVSNPILMPDLLDQARAAAIQFAQDNQVAGQPLVLDPNLTNAAGGDIVFGSIDNAAGGGFVAAQNVGDPANASLTAINAVRITGRRTRARGNPISLSAGRFLTMDSTDLTVTSTAFLDRDVIGFRPSALQSVSLAPVALLSDPNGTLPESWEFQVRQAGQQEYRYDPSTRQNVAVPNGQGVPQVQFCLGLPDATNGPNNVALLELGASDLSALTRQLSQGVTAADLAGFGGQLVIPATGPLFVNGTRVGPARTDPLLAQLWQALDELRQQGTPRIWPLYSSFDAAQGQAAVTGFVAARVVQVEPLAANAPLCVILQPTVVVSSAAVTDPARRGSGITLPNPYVCKVRLTR
jgi:hypothetical protein